MITMYEALSTLRERYPEIDLPKLPDIGAGTWPFDMMEYTVWFRGEKKNGSATRIMQFRDGHVTFRRSYEGPCLNLTDWHDLRTQIDKFADEGYVIDHQKLMMEIDANVVYKPATGE